MKKHFSLLLLIVISLSISNCKKQESINQEPTVPYDAGTIITTAIAGKITAQDGTALNGVEITIGTSTTITDVGGNFIIPKAGINKKAGFIKASKSGYFTGNRTIIAEEKVINFIVIQLVKKTQTGSFTNATGGNITIATGGSILFPANAVATKTGASYTGTVKVSAYYLDPTSDNCFVEMPGDLRGINANNNEQILTSYGMMAVELQGSNGEALQIATGKTAILTFPIAISIQANAPPTIPLWFFDETKGMWVEQGTATKTGNNYVGSVSHFTWWNCDAAFPIIDYKVKFVGFHFFPISNALVTITKKGNINNWSSIASGITTSDGRISGKIPYNEVLEMKVYANSKCLNNAPIYTATIGPFTQNTDGGIITITQNANISTAYISGTVVNCSNNPVINGYAIISIGNNKYYENIVNGVINKAIINCSGTITGNANIEVFDMDSLKKNGTPITLNITSGGTYTIGQVSACGSIAFVRYSTFIVDQYGNHYSSNMRLGYDSEVPVASDNALGVTIQIPYGKKVLRKVYQSSSNIPIDSSYVGPFTNDVQDNNIVIPQNMFYLYGTISGCTNNIIPFSIKSNINNTWHNGWSNVVLNPSNNTFQTSLTVYGGKISTGNLFFYDNLNHNLKTLNILLDSINSTTNYGIYSIKNMNLGNIQICNNPIATYFQININNKFEFADNAYLGNVVNGWYYIRGNFFDFFSPFISNLKITGLGSCIMGMQFQSQILGQYCTSLAGTTANITEYGSVGQYIAGTFSGNVKANDATNTVYPITGSFRIKRTQ